ncbi:hypothetical protein B0O80DRAFT_433189 [Mortierella sp. GBAus27b]|nr:hypothetical protein B0O80DRAFT_433189 [Mortierella sp. GBAus27b]
MKSILLLPLVLAQLAIHSYARASIPYRIQDPAGKVLEVVNGAPPPWKVVTKATSDSAPQIWVFEKRANRNVAIKNQRTSTFLTIQSRKAGDPVLASNPLEEEDSTWSIVYRDDVYEFYSVRESSLCLGESSDGTLIVADKGGCQKWKLVSAEEP